MTASRAFLYLCLSFVGGIFLSSFFDIPWIILFILLIAGIALVSVFWQEKKMAIAGFCFFFLLLGVWRHQAVLSKIGKSEIKNFINKEVVLIGLIEKEPDLRERSQGLIIQALEIKSGGEDFRPIKERILVTTWKYPEYNYGDKLKIKGKLEEPRDFEGFNYKDYLLKDGILALISFPETQILAQNEGNFLFKAAFSFKNKLKESLNAAMPRPHSALLEAVFLGEDKNLSSDWKEKLSSSGLRHITAVSGMHITIISVLLFNFLLTLGFWRKQAFYFSIALIAFYIMMIGSPSSAVRAGIMVGFLLLAQHLGRFSDSSRAVVMAAAFMLLKNPLLLKLDIGFQLSFLAILGLIYLQPILLEFFRKIPDIFQLRKNLAATLSAQIFAFPALIYNFGQVSLISPITNILVLPFVPFLKIFGLLVSLSGIFWQPLAQALSWPVWFFLEYILKIAYISSGIPLAALTFENVSRVFLIIFYLFLWLIVWRYRQKQKLKFLKY